MSRLRPKKRVARPDPKPYGFCCIPTDKLIPRHGLDTSMQSLTSIHECPALKIREQEIVKRPLSSQSRDGLKGSRGSSGVKLGLQSSLSHMKLKDATESMIELMLDEMRRERQAEYEERMDRWADIGARKAKEKKVKTKKCEQPCWYTDYSLAQLQHLKDLEDAMFKDNKENTVNRTAHCLVSIGMTTDWVTIDSHVLRKLVKEYCNDIKTFICEVYKAIRGNYFEDEGIRIDYTTHERIMISGVVFLELPQIILELHRRMPKIIKFKFPNKPKPPKLMIAKKMISPFIEKLYPAVNWRLYQTRLFKWRRKCLEIPRPVAILPKETKEIIDEIEINEEQQKAVDDNNQNDAKKAKTNVKKLDSKEKIDNGELSDKPAKKEIHKDSQQVATITEGHHRSHQKDTSFNIENPWTEPPTPCPMKFIKLFREKGPMPNDDEFFSELNREPCKNQVSPSFRLQSILLDAEAEMFGLMNEANQLTSEVTRIANEILESDKNCCDGCCSCKQTRRAHLVWHATKQPHTVVDGVVTDGGKPQVIGGMAMHSPAESLSSGSGPICVPSKEKFEKNKIITGTTMIVDGEPIREIGGVTKTLEHVSTECLLPENDIAEIKNVPPCGCRDKKTEKEVEFEKQILSAKDDEEECYGKKFRPREGPGVNCSEFMKKDKPEDCLCPDYNDGCEDEYEYGHEMYEGFDEDDCGCGIDYYKCDDTVGKATEKKKLLVCKKCGREVNPRCIDPNVKKLRKAENGGKKVTNKCSCDSLAEFLQLDLVKTKCVIPKTLYNSKVKDTDTSELKNGGKVHKSVKNPKKSETTIKSVRPKRVSQASSFVSKKIEDDKDEEKEISEHHSVDEGGPYGYRTKSEEELPIERTLAYLTDLHPPMRQAEQIQVREGGRPCRCRENRNKRKVLMYGIGGVTGDEDNKDEANTTRVIDGAVWVTPEPSIRGSDEYIPEYELADSPYEKQICSTAKRDDKKVTGGGKVGGAQGRNIEDNSEDRAKDWENAIKDDQLTEFFTKDRDATPCWTKCSKFRKEDKSTPKLKVMKPVCECKYERRIVKRNENRKKWSDRQDRLKACDKEPYLHVDDIAKPQLSDCCVTEVTVISAVTMLTPCETPEDGRSRSNLPYPVQKVDIVNKNTEKNGGDNKKAQKLEDVEDESELFEDEDEIENEKEIELKVNEKHKEVEVKENEKIDEEEEQSEEIVFMRKKMGDDYFEQAEDELAEIMKAELEKMTAENEFVSLKLPYYHKLAQLSYWISYRVRGMCFTEKYKKALWMETTKIWTSKNLKNSPSVESFKVKKKDRRKLNFDHAKYWKRKIGKLTRKFYAKARQESVDIGRIMWPTMEFGKFPHLLFKQAYYTYLPPREVDIYAFRTYYSDR